MKDSVLQNARRLVLEYERKASSNVKAIIEQAPRRTCLL